MSEEVEGSDVFKRRLIRAIDEGALGGLREFSLFIYSWMNEGEGEREKRDEQNEVYVVAEERTHDERECASCKREQEHVHGRQFVLRGKVREVVVSDKILERCEHVRSQVGC